MTDLKEPEVVEEEKTGRGLLWMLAAIAVIAVPVVIGLMLMRGTGSSDVVGGPSNTVADGMGGSGMGGDGDVVQPSGVLDFADIQATDIQLDFDPDLGTAILSVDTSIDVACSVAYGPTQALGSLATDTDMAGGAHANHHPRLVGLNSGIVWYRLQGAAADGTLYQSQLMQFEFPEGDGSGPDVSPPLPNVAGQATVSGFSSQYSDAYSARNAIDGDLTTEWSTAGDGDEAFIELDFGENMRILGVGFRTREMTDGTSITTSFTVTIGQRTYGPFEAGPGMALALFDASGSKARIDVETSTGGNTGAIEIEVYAEPEM